MIYFLFLILFSTLSAQDQLLIQNITVINLGNGTNYIADILIENGRFSQISQTNPIELPAKVMIIDGRGKYILPGLWDMHTHLDDPEMWPLNLKQNEKEDLMKLLIINGVTNVRDMGGNTEQLAEWRRNIQSKRIIGPRIFFSGSILDGNPPSWPGSLVIESKDDAIEAISNLKRNGADLIKIYSSLSEANFKYVMDYAKERNMIVSGHLPMAVRIEDASNAGLKSIEHMTGLLYSSSTKREQFFQHIKEAVNGPAKDWASYMGTNPEVVSSFDEKACIEILKLFVKNKTWQVPTLRTLWGLAHANEANLATDERIRLHSKVYQRYWNQAHQRLANNPATVDAYRAQLKLMMHVVKLMSDYGVPILAGTDISALPYAFAGYTLHDELALLVESGLSPLQALRTATVNPASYFEKEDELGRIKEDYIADFILLNANPLDNIRHTEQIYGVYSNKRFYSRSDLDALLNQIKIKYK
ncbi:MAG: amidohydrolase family protein [Calditrichaeota bacterium]|nr:amidohydrolase family protein [Calditrichota bacterium]